MFTSLKGKTAIITGASKGIGKAMALTFAKEGCNVVVLSRKKEDGQKVVDEIISFNGNAIAIAADVKSLKDMQNMAKITLDTFGEIDILCCNAGILPCSKLSEMTEAELDDVLDTNVKGTFFAVMAVQEHMKAKRYGRIILTSSITGPKTGYPGWSHYGASKAAQLGFMHTAAIELAPYQITVNAVLPGNVLTEGLKDLGQEYINQMSQSVPLGSIGSPFDIANAALFLASDEASYITSHSMIIDGGQIFPESFMALDSLRHEYIK